MKSLPALRQMLLLYFVAAGRVEPEYTADELAEMITQTTGNDCKKLLDKYVKTTTGVVQNVGHVLHSELIGRNYIVPDDVLNSISVLIEIIKSNPTMMAVLPKEIDINVMKDSLINLLLQPVRQDAPVEPAKAIHSGNATVCIGERPHGIEWNKLVNWCAHEKRAQYNSFIEEQLHVIVTESKRQLLEGRKRYDIIAILKVLGSDYDVYHDNFSFKTGLGQFIINKLSPFIAKA